MAATLFPLFSVIVLICLQVFKVHADVDFSVTMWSDGGCKNNANYYDFEDEEYCGYWDSNPASSLSIHYGSCALMWKNQNCDEDATYLAWPGPLEACDLPCCGWNDHILGMGICPKWQSDIVCPDGTWARGVQPANDDLLSGITIRCYAPGDSKPSSTLNTHGQDPSGREILCGASARGLLYDGYGDLNVFSKAEAMCDFSANQPPNSFQCQEFEAMVGIVAVIEDFSDAIKLMGIFCREVPDPTEFCRPTEKLATILTCDNEGGTTNLDCGYSKTTGVGASSESSQTERQEQSFYANFGMTISATWQGLGPSFSAEIGSSNLVAYEWSTSDSSTWHEEVTVEVSFSAPPHTITVLEQLIGKCSFYGVNANYFKRTDKRRDGTTLVSYWKYSDENGGLVFLSNDTFIPDESRPNPSNTHTPSRHTPSHIRLVGMNKSDNTKFTRTARNNPQPKFHEEHQANRNISLSNFVKKSTKSRVSY